MITDKTCFYNTANTDTVVPKLIVTELIQV